MPGVHGALRLSERDEYLPHPACEGTSAHGARPVVKVDARLQELHHGGVDHRDVAIAAVVREVAGHRGAEGSTLRAGHACTVSSRARPVAAEAGAVSKTLRFGLNARKTASWPRGARPNKHGPWLDQRRLLCRARAWCCFAVAESAKLDPARRPHPVGASAVCGERRSACVGFGTRRLVAGVRRHPWRAALSCYLAFAGLWTVAEPFAQHVAPGIAHAWGLAVLAAAALLLGASRVALRRHVEFMLPHSNTTVAITPGNLLEFDGHVVIPVNDGFDCEVGPRVSQTSLHGQCIERLYAGDTARFAADVENALRDVSPAPPERPDAHRRYPIGTVAAIPHGKHKLFLVAVAHTDERTHKATTDVDKLLLAWRRVWEAVRVHANGFPIAAPVMGTGLAGVPLPYADAFRIALIALTRESKERAVASRIDFLVPEAQTVTTDIRQFVPENDHG